MKTKSPKAVMRKVILVCLFISVPAILVSGYAVYSFRIFVEAKFDIKIPEFAYLTTLLVVMWAAMWLTAGKLINEIRRPQKSDKDE
jgi:K+-sensing histidine kinase KdpD